MNRDLSTPAHLRSQDVACVTAMPAFSDVPLADIKALLRTAWAIDLPAGQAVCSEGTAVEHLYILLDGQARVHTRADDEHDNVMRVVCRPGDFPVLALFGATRYPASCETLTPARVLVLPFSQVLQRMAQCPKLSLGLLHELLRRQRQDARRAAELKTKTVAQRLARYLVELASPDIGPAVVMLPYPRTVLAELIGVSPEKLSRNFTVLKDFGVSSRGRRVIIEDTTRLESFYADRKSQA